MGLGSVSYNEQVVTFACGQEMLTGILAGPGEHASVGVVVVVGGPQYRVGSHRQFVLLSRMLAGHGFSVLRFDYRGMGDSEGSRRDFANVTADIGTAIEALQNQRPTVKSVVLWGLCDGASAALLYSHHTRDERVCGLCLLNPWVRSEASLARAQVKHYYVQRFRQKEFWIKLCSGKVATTALTDLWQKIRLMGSGAEQRPTRELPFQQRMAHGWNSYPGSVLLLLSGNDYTAKEFLEYVAMYPEWKGLLDRANVTRHDLPDADHTFSDVAAHKEVEALTLTWLKTLRT